MKIIFHIIFSCFFYVFKLIIPQSNKITYIMTHDNDLKNGNIAYVYQYLKEEKVKYKHYFIKKNDYRLISSENLARIIYKAFKGFIINSFHLATSKYVFMDNIFLPTAFFKFKKNVKVVQLWHGSGAIKKFGQDVNKGTLAWLERKANSRYTHLIAASDNMVDIYHSAFNVDKSIIYSTGLPRIDFFYDDEKIQASKRNFYEEFPELINKKIILYAPTFRDDEVKEPQIKLEFDLLESSLGDEYAILLKVHPFIMDRVEVESDNNFIFNFSKYTDINTLLIVADILISDYSSIIYEYSLLNRPMIFYAYDLENYQKKNRGFYHNYFEYVPGPVVFNTKEIIDTILNKSYDLDRVKRFVASEHKYFDGSCTKRVIDLVFSSGGKKSNIQ